MQQGPTCGTPRGVTGPRDLPHTGALMVLPQKQNYWSCSNYWVAERKAGGEGKEEWGQPRDPCWPHLAGYRDGHISKLVSHVPQAPAAPEAISAPPQCSSPVLTLCLARSPAEGTAAEAGEQGRLARREERLLAGDLASCPGAEGEDKAHCWTPAPDPAGSPHLPMDKGGERWLKPSWEPPPFSMFQHEDECTDSSSLALLFSPSLHWPHLTVTWLINIKHQDIMFFQPLSPLSFLPSQATGYNWICLLVPLESLSGKGRETKMYPFGCQNKVRKFVYTGQTRWL